MSKLIFDRLLVYEKTLLELDADKFTKFDLNGFKTTMKVLSIYDTDTITVGFRYSSKWVKTNVRLAGLDSPELKSKVAKEAKLCRLGKQWLKQNYLNKLVIVQCYEMDKYGRLLADIYDRMDPSIHINKQLIDLKFARVYGGNLHKNTWTDDELEEGITSAEALNLVDTVADIETTEG